jgi:ankyrin repeat protein
MFPNPQDALPLPPRPSLEQYKKLAKDLVKACKSADPTALRAWAAQWVEALVTLTHLVITPDLPVRIDRWVDQVEDFARRKLSQSPGANCSLAGAQFVVARSHGFDSWPRFAKHLEDLARASSPGSRFETAADAIVSGDEATLVRLLHEAPDLVQARSAREHEATLLHYVSANGVEGYRQKTPQNAVRIAEVLLNAGAEVDAEADVYGGHATTLELIATSLHPERAGVQDELIAILLDHGAAIDHANSAGQTSSIVSACLANGRGPAAEFLAQRGARLDLEAAAGVGRLDVVKTFFSETGSFEPTATKMQMDRGFLWACEYGRASIVEFLLQKGVDIHTQADTGETALHWAVIGGQLEIIRLLLQRGASLEVNNAYDGTSLGQALWSAINGNPEIDYARVVETLLEAGARIEDGSLAWLAGQTGGSASLKARIAGLLRSHGAKS